MKMGTAKVKAPATQPRRRPANPITQPPANDDGWVRGKTFLFNLVKASGITRKELQYELRWSDTYIDRILSGEKNDPLEQSRKICAAFRMRQRMDLVAAAIVHVAGGGDFDGRVLTATQVEALKELAKVV